MDLIQAETLREIPNLTFEQFKAFHEKYYHPSNARVFFYGNDEPEERLRLVNDYLKDFHRLPVDSAIPLQPRFQEPRRVARAFPSGEDSLKAMFTLNWLLDETHRIEQNLGFHMLEYMLLGMPGSPLRKALMDSRLGEDLAGAASEANCVRCISQQASKAFQPNVRTRWKP